MPSGRSNLPTMDLWYKEQAQFVKEIRDFSRSKAEGYISSGFGWNRKKKAGTYHPEQKDLYERWKDAEWRWESNFERRWDYFRNRRWDRKKSDRSAATKAWYVKVSPKSAIQIPLEHQRAFFAGIVRQMDGVRDASLTAYDKHFGTMALEMARKWPVDSGVSRGMLILGFDVPAEGVYVGTIGSGAPYTPFIKPGKLWTQAADKAKAEREATGQLELIKGTWSRGKTPPWKLKFLVEVGGKWVFDEAAYLRAKAARGAEPGETGMEMYERLRKPAINRPYQEYVRKPSKPTLLKIAAEVKDAANRGKV